MSQCFASKMFKSSEGQDHEKTTWGTLPPQGPWIQSGLQISVCGAVRDSGQEDEEAGGGAQGALLQGAESAA